MVLSIHVQSIELFDDKDEFARYLNSFDNVAYVKKLDGPVSFDEYRNSFISANVEFTEYDLYEEWKKLAKIGVKDKLLIVWEITDEFLTGKTINADFYGTETTKIERSKYALVFFNQVNSENYYFYEPCGSVQLESLDSKKFENLSGLHLIKQALVDYMVEVNYKHCVK